MARKESWKWENHLDQVLLTKPAEVVQEACQVLEEHGCLVKEKLKSELYYSSTLCQVVFQVLHYANLIVAHALTVQTALISTMSFSNFHVHFTCVQLSSVYCVVKMCTQHTA